MIHPVDVQVEWDLGNPEARLTLWALRHVPQVVPEQLLQWCSCVVLQGDRCHQVVSSPWAAALCLQRCLGQWCFYNRRPREGWDSKFPCRTWHCHKIISVGFNLVADFCMYTLQTNIQTKNTSTDTQKTSSNKHKTSTKRHQTTTAPLSLPAGDEQDEPEAAGKLSESPSSDEAASGPAGVCWHSFSCFFTGYLRNKPFYFNYTLLWF